MKYNYPIISLDESYTTIYPSHHYKRWIRKFRKGELDSKKIELVCNFKIYQRNKCAGPRMDEVAMINIQEMKRRLHTVMSHLLNDILFDIPDKIAANIVITIDANLIDSRLKDVTKNRDLSEYIL